MERPPTLPGVTSSFVETPRLRIHLLSAGPADGAPVVFLHGNLAAATYWEETMLALPAGFRGLAPDLRGYGWTEDKPIDATRGPRDWADDLEALRLAMALESWHLVGWSLGGPAAMQYLLDHAPAVRSLTLVAPGSPYGYGGTKGLDGTPVNPDYSGTGGGAAAANAELIKRLAEGDRSAGPSSPRQALLAMYKAPFRPAREEELLTATLATKMGPDRFPGDYVASAYWPFVAPGRWGPANAISPKYCRLDALPAVEPKPAVLWVRGSHDLTVSDMAMGDFGALGKLGLVPGWPGEEAYPPQPMLAQTRAVLDRYQAAGGRYTELVIADTAHAPHIEKPGEFSAVFHEFLMRNA